MNLKTLTFTTYLKDGEVCINQDGKDIVVTNLSAVVTVIGYKFETVWQYDIDGIWFNVPSDYYSIYKDFNEFKKLHSELETRQALHYTGKQAESEQKKSRFYSVPFDAESAEKVKNMLDAAERGDIELIHRSEQAKEESVSNRDVYKNDALDIFKSIEADSFERKHIPIEDESWRDGYLNGYIIGREKSQQSQSATIKETVQYIIDNYEEFGKKGIRDAPRNRTTT